MTAPVAAIAAEPVLPDGVTLRQVSERADLDGIAAMEHAVWNDDRGWLAESLEVEQAADPDAMTIVVAEARGGIVCAAWVRFVRGTEFATLWGGATLAEWRGRGIYRAIVAYQRTWPRREGSGTCRWTLLTTVARSSSASASSSSAPPRRTFGRPLPREGPWQAAADQ